MRSTPGSDSGNEALVRAAYEAFSSGDVTALLEHVHPDLEWTYLDPSVADPQPQTCHGSGQLRWAMQHRAQQGARPQIEEVTASGDKVLVVVHTPGLDEQRARQADDRNYLVVTVRDGQITAMRACRDRNEARRMAGLG